MEDWDAPAYSQDQGPRHVKEAKVDTQPQLHHLTQIRDLRIMGS